MHGYLNLNSVYSCNNGKLPTISKYSIHKQINKSITYARLTKPQSSTLAFEIG